MKISARVVIVLAAGCLGLARFAGAADDAAKPKELAAAVIKASGGESWPKVKTIDFTFNVAQGDKVLLSATHHWDVAANTDTVTWGAKRATVDLASPPPGGDAMEAFKRWTNDSYWLIAPLKLLDRGTELKYEGTKQMDGKTFEVLQLGFQHVGLTPGDHYNLYIDPESHLIRHWDYMPAPTQKVSGDWNDYKEFGGLTLSVDRKFGDKHIYFTDVAVKTE